MMIRRRIQLIEKLHKKYLIAYPSDDVSAYSHLNLGFPQLSARLSILPSLVCKLWLLKSGSKKQ
jgi:hypothetical protein